MPGIFKRFDLRLALAAMFILKQDVIISIGIKRRIEVDEINTLVRHVLAQDIQVIAVEQRIFCDGAWCH